MTPDNQSAGSQHKILIVEDEVDQAEMLRAYFGAQDYTVLVTGDHGINDDKLHGGTTPDVRNVPLYVIPSDGQGQGDTQETVSQLQIAPTVCRLLDVPVPETMTQPPLLD